MRAVGLVRFANNDELKAAEAKTYEANRAAREESFESSLAAYIRRAWEANRRAKESVKTRLLTCLRNRVGEYDPDTKAEIDKTGGSDIFMMLTATKCRAAKAWIRDILLPADQKSWGLDPSPIPDLPPDVMMRVYQEVAGAVQAEMAQRNQPFTEAEYMERVDRMQDEVKRRAKERARERADRMELKIHDQLTEGDYYRSMDDFIDDLVTFPAAILKGPTLRMRPKLTWGRDFETIVTYEPRMEIARLNPFNAYPSADSVDVNDGDFIERIQFRPAELYDSLELPGFKREALEEVLEHHGIGGLREWLWEDNERRQLEGRSMEQYSDSTLIDGLRYCGPAQGKMLLEWGYDPAEIEHPLKYYEVDAILIGRFVVRCLINQDPLNRRDYYKTSFQKIPGAWWGTCPPELMEDNQRMCNAAARAVANNLGISAYPMCEVHVDRLAPGEDPTHIYPGRVFQTLSDPSGGNSPAIHFFGPQSHAQELLKVYEEFERRADDATNIPRYAYGNERVTGAAGTARGLSMLLNGATKGIKAAVAQVDLDVTSRVVERFYFENMTNNPDPTIKGDCVVVARGASALIAREQTRAEQMEMLELTNNPVDLQIMGLPGRADLLRTVFKNSEIPEKTIPTREELENRLKAEQEQAAKQPDPELVKEEMTDQREREGMELDAQIDREKMQNDLRIAAMRQHGQQNTRAPAAGATAPERNERFSRPPAVV